LIVRGVGYRQPKWEQRIAGIGCGLWPTATGGGIDRGEGQIGQLRRLVDESKLTRAEAEQMLQGSMEPARMSAWPTPTQQDGENNGGASQYERNPVPLNAAAKPQGDTGQLNPDWVEWLMGWPIGWTSLDPIQELNWLGWETDPADSGTIPRIGTGIPDRVNRLKAIGNGQVPRCVAAAWRLLTGAA